MKLSLEPVSGFEDQFVILQVNHHRRTGTLPWPHQRRMHPRAPRDQWSTETPGQTGWPEQHWRITSI